MEVRIWLKVSLVWKICKDKAWSVWWSTLDIMGQDQGGTFSHGYYRIKKWISKQPCWLSRVSVLVRNVLALSSAIGALDQGAMSCLNPKASLFPTVCHFWMLIAKWIIIIYWNTWIQSHLPIVQAYTKSNTNTFNI